MSASGDRDVTARPGMDEAVEAVHAATCQVPGCLARYDARVAVDAAYDHIAAAVRAEHGERIAAAVDAERGALCVLPGYWDGYIDGLGFAAAIARRLSAAETGGEG